MYPFISQVLIGFRLERMSRECVLALALAGGRGWGLILLLCQIKKLLYSKGNHQQSEKKIYMLRENICNLYV